MLREIHVANTKSKNNQIAIGRNNHIDDGESSNRRCDENTGSIVFTIRGIGEVLFVMEKMKASLRP